MRLWFKWAAPILLILFLWPAYTGYDRWRAGQRQRLDRLHALVTAQVWIATARYRNAPDRYLTFRDSVLAANRLSARQMFEYLQRYRERPEQYQPFTAAVNYYVDSLCRAEDSVRRRAASHAADSASSP